MLVKREGIQLKVVPSLPDNTFDLAAFEKILAGGVRLVSIGMTSNLDGVTVPAAEITKLAHKHGALVYLMRLSPHRTGR
jgi:cysteine desulfurase/selenocysteine lyase